MGPFHRRHACVRMRDGAAARRGLQRHREPRSTSFWSAACSLSPAGHCAARGSRAHHRVDQLADWPRSAVRFICISELSYALFARARESSELCSHFKSLPPVAARDLSTNVTWHAHIRKPGKAPRRPRPRIGPVLGEGGDKSGAWFGRTGGPFVDRRGPDRATLFAAKVLLLLPAAGAAEVKREPRPRERHNAPSL